MKNSTKITEKIFAENLLNNTRANKIVLTYYSFRSHTTITLSVCRKSKSALKSAVEYLFANKDMKEILIDAWMVQKNAWGGSSEYHEYSTVLTLEELNEAMA